MDEVLDGYRATGNFRPENWLFVQPTARTLACCCWPSHRAAKHWELMYMGLAPRRAAQIRSRRRAARASDGARRGCGTSRVGRRRRKHSGDQDVQRNRIPRVGSPQCVRALPRRGFSITRIALISRRGNRPRGLKLSFHSRRSEARKNFSTAPTATKAMISAVPPLGIAKRRQLFPRDLADPFDMGASRRRIVDSGDSRSAVLRVVRVNDYSFGLRILASRARRRRRPFLWVGLVSPVVR